jgi:hypothetical protein
MRRSVLRAACLAGAALVVTMAVPAHAAGNPLAGLSADQIASKAVKDLKTAPSVHLTGWGKDSGQLVTISMSLSSKGCDGTMGLAHKGSFVLLSIGKRAWIKPSDEFWETEGGVSKSELSLVSGKYIAFSGSLAKGLSGLRRFCTPKGFAANFTGQVTGLITGRTTSIGGHPAVELKDSGGSGYVYVSVSPKPEMLRADLPGTGGFSFSHYGAKVTLTPPPAGDVIKIP